VEENRDWLAHRKVALFTSSRLDMASLDTAHRAAMEAFAHATGSPLNNADTLD
jgi:hypothetical protein